MAIAVCVVATNSDPVFSKLSDVVSKAQDCREISIIPKPRPHVS